jgi:hypothetical protein
MRNHLDREVEYEQVGRAGHEKHAEHDRQQKGVEHADALSPEVAGASGDMHGQRASPCCAWW